MSLSSNFIGSISPEKIGGKQVTVAPDFDLNDKTFSDILDKQMDDKTQVNKTNNAIPNGFNIDELISMQQANNAKAAERHTSTNPINPINFDDLISKDDEHAISNSEMLTFYTSLFDKNSETNLHNGIGNFVRKQAANFYGKCAGNVITDIGEFVSDALKLS